MHSMTSTVMDAPTRPGEALYRREVEARARNQARWGLHGQGGDAARGSWVGRACGGGSGVRGPAAAVAWPAGA